MPYAHHHADACAIQQLNDLTGLGLQRVRPDVSGLVGATIAEEVRREHAVSQRGEIRELASPVIGGRGEAVQEEDGQLFRPVWGVVHVAVGPTGGQTRGANVRDVADAGEIGLEARVSNSG